MYFHILIIGRRRRLFIHNTKTEKGHWIQGDAEIVEASYNNF